MKNRNFTISAMVIALCCTGGAASYAQAQYNQNNAQYDNDRNVVQPDNTRVNMRDRNVNERTADQQKDDQSDRSITQRIRRALMDDKSLSTYAHNVKIISEGGNVVLKGPVRSARERNVVVEKAVAVAGSRDRVTDRISIKP